MTKVTIMLGDAHYLLSTLPENSVQSTITSPPYYALRDYGHSGQIGQEQTLEEYLNNLKRITRHLLRVTKKDGSCFINLGGSYGGTGDKKDHKDPKFAEARNGQSISLTKNLKAKSLCLVPYKVAEIMSEQGWIIRNILIWHKPNAMPQPVNDRWVVDYEPIIFAVKNKKYKHNQRLEPYTKPMNRWGGTKNEANGVSIWDEGVGQNTYRKRSLRPNPKGRKPRTVMSIPTKASGDKHIASFPEKLVEELLLSSTNEGDTVLDPFCGRGTVGICATRHSRNFMGMEIVPEYVELCNKNLSLIYANS